MQWPTKRVSCVAVVAIVVAVARKKKQVNYVAADCSLWQQQQLQPRT